MAPSPDAHEVMMSRFNEALDKHIANEFAASQQYIAIAAWYDDRTLPQLAAHFYRQALEERNHAMMIVQYLLDAGATVTIPGVDAPRCEFDSYTEPVQLALDQEREVTRLIADLAHLAREEGDLVGEQFLAWFLTEQREEEASMADLLRTVERASETNILLADDYLSRNQVGDAGESAGAPEAAGGTL
jgi:ferritin